VEVSKPPQRRRKDPVADPSSLESSGFMRFRERRNASAVQEQGPKVQIVIFLDILPYLSVSAI
jgi:hypothetical protein